MLLSPPLVQAPEAEVLPGLDVGIALVEGEASASEPAIVGGGSGVDPLTGMVEAQVGIVGTDDGADGDLVVFDYTGTIGTDATGTDTTTLVNSTADLTASSPPPTGSLLGELAAAGSVTDIVDALEDTLAQTTPQTLTADVVADVLRTTLPADTSPEVMEAVTEELVRRGVVFIDTRVLDYEVLLAGVADGFSVYLLDSNQNGIQQVTDVLSGYGSVNSLHLVTEGNIGNFWLGGTFLYNANLDDYAADLQNWSLYLAPGADLLLYSCDLAANQEGTAFVNRLGRIVGADVAASTNRTGAGGDWVFEYTLGEITSPLAFNGETQAAYGGSLAVFTVTTATDVVVTDGEVSLREAIQAANTNTAITGDVSAGDTTLDRIYFAPGINSVNVTAGEIAITGGGDLLISGEGTFRTISAGGSSRIFDISSPDTVTLDFLQLINGNGGGAMSSGAGGAILHRNGGVLNVENSTFSSNQAPSGVGGAIFSNAGSLNISNSTFSNNTASSNGGAINVSGGSVDIANSTFSNNNSNGDGGAIWTQVVSTITNSTLSGNKAAVNGGGIANLGGNLTVTNATIVANTADSDSNNSGNGGGVYNTGTATINNSIIARNYDFVGTQHRNVSGNFTSNGHNLLGDTAGSTGFGGTDLISSTYDTNLFTTILQNSLTSNGGLTANYALRSGSPAIDAGAAGGPTIDQRGALRDASPDIGAYEASSTYVVTNTRDDRSIGSLRSAITFANININPVSSNPADTIQFNIPTGDPGNVGGATGYWSIAPKSALPTISQTVTIDGFSQPGSGPSGSGHNIEINGLNAGSTTTGLLFTAGASGSTVTGLTINRFGQDGIFVNGGTNYIITDNRLGTDVTGTLNQGNGRNGLTITANNSQIEDNIASGNAQDGIGGSGNGNLIQGNRLGVDATGTVAIGNTGSGLNFFGTANNNQVRANVISGNGLNGLVLGGSTHTNTIEDNLIGTNATGTAAIGNTASGIRIGGNNNLIQDNTISGNLQHGVHLTGSGAFNNVLLRNYIGVNSTGSAALGNQIQGIQINGGANNNRIGNSLGIDFSDRNVISGNGANGILITGATSSNNLIRWNYIGTDATGTADLTAFGSGVAIVQAANNQVFNNLISGNGSAGVWISGSNSSGNTVINNRIGTNFDGSAALSTVGVQNTGVHLLESANNNTISGNLISGNVHGIILRDSGTNNNLIQNNFIGTNVTGTAAIPNRGYGVGLYTGASNNSIIDNLISGNWFDGVYISSLNTTNNLVDSNQIGTNLAGNGAIPNGGTGVRIQAAPGNVISNNLLSGNGQFGVWIWGHSAQGNQILGNYIGTNLTGTASVGNAQGGIWISDAAKNNQIGNGTISGINLISGNGGSGVVITGIGTSGNQVNRNYIGTNITGNAALPNNNSGLELRNGVTSSQILNNVISGNLARGIVIRSSTTGITSNNTVINNYVGTNASGTSAIANGQDGLLINNAHSNTIGGSMAQRNLFSGNGGYGVRIIGTGSTGNQITFNYIGRADDTTALSNGLDSDPLLVNGVKLGTAVTGNIINSNLF